MTATAQRPVSLVDGVCTNQFSTVFLIGSLHSPAGIAFRTEHCKTLAAPSGFASINLITSDPDALNQRVPGSSPRN